ncbi:hypothetical protein HK097_010748 [Rhizophlyctis rosea]|uniref:Uncharacterized protein n=1 Tax=Rhizophlyctis rosea TaxID=64517 RepID=A0AAD5X0A6_9FUNG|nr:hypothetical protein HK097_010748 [Rhizophlyctis rosea]
MRFRSPLRKTIPASSFRSARDQLKDPGGERAPVASSWQPLVGSIHDPRGSSNYYDETEKFLADDGDQFDEFPPTTQATPLPMSFQRQQRNFYKPNFAKRAVPVEINPVTTRESPLRNKGPPPPRNDHAGPIAAGIPLISVSELC